MVSRFNDKVFSFVINSIQDVLPHNVNLSRWRKSDTKKCPLCSSDQTLMHVLNNCSVSLKTNRYTWRHNAVLAALVDYIERNLAVSWQLCADLPGRRYSLPYEMGDITARPDIFAWSTMQKQVVMFELTIPFEENITDAARRKQERYVPLCSHLSSLGWGTKLYTIQVGSRGLLDMSSLKSIENFTNSRQSKKSFLCLLHKICRIVIGCSFAIWCKRNKSDWKDTDLFI